MRACLRLAVLASREQATPRILTILGRGDICTTTQIKPCPEQGFVTTTNDGLKQRRRGKYVKLETQTGDKIQRVAFLSTSSGDQSKNSRLTKNGTDDTHSSYPKIHFPLGSPATTTTKDGMYNTQDRHIRLLLL
ncbi:unnamed protein product [Ectocarpus sp. 12 AP-2014]